MDIQQDVTALETQSQEVAKKEHDKAITTGQALHSPLCVRETSLHFLASTERPTPQASIVNTNSNTTSVSGNGAIVNDKNWIPYIVQNREERVCTLVKA